MILVTVTASAFAAISPAIVRSRTCRASSSGSTTWVGPHSKPCFIRQHRRQHRRSITLGWRVQRPTKVCMCGVEGWGEGLWNREQGDVVYVTGGATGAEKVPLHPRAMGVPRDEERYRGHCDGHKGTHVGRSRGRQGPYHPQSTRPVSVGVGQVQEKINMVIGRRCGKQPAFSVTLQGPTRRAV